MSQNPRLRNNQTLRSVSSQSKTAAQENQTVAVTMISSFFHAKKRNSPPVPKKRVTADAETIDIGKKELKKLIKKMKPVTPEKPHDPFKQHHANSSEATENSCVSLWQEQMKFHCVVGDHQSAMLVDRESCPTNPLPATPRGFCSFADCRFAENGTL